MSDDPNWEQKAIVKLRSVKPPCDHYSYLAHGQIRCKHCKAIWTIGLNGPIWVEADA